MHTYMYFFQNEGTNEILIILQDCIFRI